MRKKFFLAHYQIYLLLFPTVVYFIVFHYVPMYGIVLAFKDYNPLLGIWGSPWVGFEHFERFFNSYYFWTLIRNTVSISLYSLLVNFPLPIILALLLNEARNAWFRKTVQTATYAPHFISTVVMSGMVIMFFSPQSGLIGQVLVWLGMDPVSLLTRPEWFQTIYVWSGVWQEIGWWSIIYMAALAGIDPQLHEAAKMDGATVMQRIRHINLPGIRPVMVILLILSVGNVMSVGFEKIYLLQNSLNLDASEVIATYVYKTGLLQAQYEFSTAVNLFNAAINFALLLTVNGIARKVNDSSLW